MFASQLACTTEQDRRTRPVVALVQLSSRKSSFTILFIALIVMPQAALKGVMPL